MHSDDDSEALKDTDVFEEPSDRSPAAGDRWTESTYRRLSDYVDRSAASLLSGECVEIDSELIVRAEAAQETLLPVYLVREELLEPVAEEWGDEAVHKHVADTLLAAPLVAETRKTSRLLREACRVRLESLNRQAARLVDRQAGMPLKIPASKASGRTDAEGRWGQIPFRMWLGEVVTFWRNWAGVGVAALAIALVMTVGLEILSQVNGLRQSSWELVQTYTGAFGFTWGFTIAVVAFTRWREQVRDSPAASHLCQVMSRRFFYIAWIGLANMGLHLGLMHSFDEGEPWLFGLHRCVLTTMSVVSLGGVGVVIEKWTLYSARRAYGETLVDNDAIEAMEPAIHRVVSKQVLVQQLLMLCDAIDERLDRHIDSVAACWQSRRRVFQQRNDAARRRAEAVNKLQAAQRYLDSLEV